MVSAATTRPNSAICRRVSSAETRKIWRLHRSSAPTNGERSNNASGIEDKHTKLMPTNESVVRSLFLNNLFFLHMFECVFAISNILISN